MFTKNDDYIALSGDTGDFELLHKNYELSELAQIFPNVNSIFVPKKAEYNLRKYVPKASLKEIDANINTAVEKCLLVLSNLASTYYVDGNEEEENRWKRLHSKILHEQTKKRSNTHIYNKIIDVLKEGTAKGSMLEVCNDEILNVQSRNYKIPDNYFDAGITEYHIKDSGIITTRNRLFYQQLANAMTNPISVNLVRMYPKIELPTSVELLAIGKTLVKEGRTTKKGKLLTMRNKHKNHYWSDWQNRSFIEDNIKLFEFLTGRGFMIPSAGDAASGGRVVDSFTLMPAWIRELITIDGKKLVECDYTALHPNIAVHLYGGKESYITHQKVAKKAAIEVKTVKVEHLAFFNKNWFAMKNSPLYKYYSKQEPLMLERIRKDKATNSYKITSRRMFEVEVNIMADVITNLNANGIQVLYVYDALVCEEKDKPVVIETMNRIILEHGVKTSVKATEPLTAELLSIEAIKNKLSTMINHEQYQVKESDIKTMLTAFDHKTIEEFNAFYNYILESV